MMIAQSAFAFPATIPTVTAPIAKIAINVCQSYIDQLATSQAALVQCQIDKTDLEAQVQTLSDDLSNEQAAHQATQAALDVCNDTLTSTGGDNLDLNIQIQDLTAQTVFLAAQIADRDAMIAALQGQNQGLSFSFDEIKKLLTKSIKNIKKKGYSKAQKKNKKALDEIETAKAFFAN